VSLIAFDPLGSYDPTAPIAPSVLAKAIALRKSLPTAPYRSLSRLYLHWTLAPFGCTFADYNAEVDFEAGDWVMIVTHDPRDNAAGLTSGVGAAHTWRRNTGAVGVAIAGMTGAMQQHFGPAGVTPIGLDHLCAAAAAFASRYGINALGMVEHGSTHADNNGDLVNTTGEQSVLTHAECASIDGYLCGFTSDPDCRWDLGSLVALPADMSLTKAMVWRCGDALRQRVQAYTAALAGTS
jgi:hypothetical protein